MSFPATRRFLNRVDDLLVTKTILDVYEQVTGHPWRKNATELDADAVLELMGEVSAKVGEQMKHELLRAKANQVLDEIIRTVVEQTNEEQAIEMQFEVEEILTVAMYGKPEKDMNPHVLARAIELFFQKGKFVRWPQLSSVIAAHKRAGEHHV